MESGKMAAVAAAKIVIFFIVASSVELSFPHASITHIIIVLFPCSRIDLMKRVFLLPVWLMFWPALYSKGG